MKSTQALAFHLPQNRSFASSGWVAYLFSLDAPSSSDNKPMITSIHTLIYSDDANATRAFLRDVLGWKYVAEDFDNDWLIFRSGPSEMGVHPTHSEWKGQTYDHPRHHLIGLMCDDIDATVGELRA